MKLYEIVLFGKINSSTRDLFPHILSFKRIILYSGIHTF